MKCVLGVIIDVIKTSDVQTQIYKVYNHDIYFFIYNNAHFSDDSFIMYSNDKCMHTVGSNLVKFNTFIYYCH
jgi:hypothetical protein